MRICKAEEYIQTKTNNSVSLAPSALVASSALTCTTMCSGCVATRLLADAIAAEAEGEAEEDNDDEDGAD